MPVTSTKQARVDLTEKQYALIGELFAAAAKTRVPMVSIEETNMEGTVAAITKRGTTLINADGSYWDLGGKGAVSDLSR